MPDSGVAEIRKAVGILLRLPIVALLGLLWAVYIWSVIVAFAISVSVVLLILHPLAYPILYVLTWLAMAFQNDSHSEVLPGYFEHYPECYFDWCLRCIKLGFPTLYRWLSKGFSG